MRKLSKRLLAVVLSVIMAVPTLLVMPFAAEAVTEWTPIASSDFTKLSEAVTNGSLGQVPTYNDMGNAMTWSTGLWTGNGNAELSSDGALYIPDGYIYLSGYETGLVPISGVSNWKINVGFRFKNITENDVHVTDGYHADEEHCFIKMYYGTDALTNPENAKHDHCYFEQNANGLCYSYDATAGKGSEDPDNAICTGSKFLEPGVNYQYVAEYTEGTLFVYITNESGEIVQYVLETDDEDIISSLANPASITSIKLGDDDNAAYYRSLEYRNVTFYSGTETGTPEDRMQEAIELYETKMSGVYIFSGMADAYDKYVDAYKAYDAWKYGDKDIDLDTYSRALRKATVNMFPWRYDGYENDVTPWFENDSGDNALYAANGVGNILHWENAQKYTNTNAGVTIELWQPANTVLLLDGFKTPAMPVMGVAQKTVSKSRYIYQLYPSASSSDNANSPYFRLGTVNGETAWYAHNGNTNRNYDWIWSISSTDNLGRIKGEAGEPSTSTRIEMSRNWFTNYWASFANVMKFVGNQSDYLHSYNISWYRVSGDDPNDTGYMTTDATVQVLNYKALLDLMQSATNMSLLNIPEETYTQGGLRPILEAYDLATSVDITSYDYNNSSDVTAAGNAIAQAAAAFNSASVTQDVPGYDALRSAIKAKKSTYAAGSEGYTPESWAAFAQAYEDAAAIFENIQTTGYNDAANAQAKADALNAAELVTIVEKVDSSALEIAIDEADDAIANASMFTAASYEASNIEAVTNAAKTAVWGNPANYPNAKFKLDLSDDNTAIVSDQTDLVKAAIYALRIDKTTVVVSAAEQSMESAIALAANYSPADYGNYVDLASAVSAANSFVVTVNTVTKGCITAKIAEYKTKVRAIITAINLLRPAFDKITNGTWGSYSANNTTSIDSTEGGSRWRLNFIRNNDVVVFRTQYEPFTVDLGSATFEWYTRENFDADLDSINIYDEAENTVGEIVTNWAAAGGTPASGTISNPDEYPGLLSAGTDENSAYTIKNLTVTQASSDILGRNENGEAIYDNSYIFDEILSSTQGSDTNAREGTVTTKNGTTYINGEFNISIPRESKKKLSADTLPTMTAHTLSSNIGMVYIWTYQPFLKYTGYSHNRAPYTQTTYVMNVAPLMELITTARALEADEAQYKIASWNTFSTALSEARADMDYGNMTASDIEAACQTRYTNLWNAYTALEKAATNTSIHSAVESDEAVGNTYKADNKDGRWSATRWATFKNAYETAAAAIANGGTYSDTNVRNYGTEKQSEIDAIASALTTAYNELITYGARADFTALLNAAGRIGYEALENDKYTASSLSAVANALSDAVQFPYLNMTEAERNAVYSETADVQAIAAEVTAVENVYATVPVEAVVDSAALEAAKATAKASITNPDAYSNIDEIKALIDAADYSQSVTIFGDYAVSGVKYDTQEELDGAVSEILDGLNTKAYEVKVVDADGNAVNAVFKDEEGNVIESTGGKLSLDYGTKVVVYAPGEENVDWFYSYKSNTVSRTQSKYYTTDKWIHLTVRGDTTLVIKSAAAQTETVKVTYVNAQTGKTFAVDYTAKDAEYTLEEAPTLPYYTFAGYALEADSDEYVSSITPSEDVIVYAVYEFDETKDYFTVTLANVNGSITTTQYLVEDFEYNDLVEFTVGDGSYNTENSGIYQSSKKNGQYKVNGETSNLPGTNKNPIKYTSSEIYAWAVVKADDMDDWDEYRDTAAQADYLQNVEQVVMYGDSYSFRVCEDVYVIPYSEDEFNEAVEAGLIEGVSATEKAAVYAKDKILDETGGQKISMIGNFTLPEGCELVEAGMLFKATTNGTIPTADLTLANAGTNGIARMKSSSHTAGNQFVISVNTKKFIGTNTTIGVIFRAYLIYTDGTEQFVVYSDNVTDSAVIE